MLDLSHNFWTVAKISMPKAEDTGKARLEWIWDKLSTYGGYGIGA
jgi:hypothetical protein